MAGELKTQTTHTAVLSDTRPAAKRRRHQRAADADASSPPPPPPPPPRPYKVPDLAALAHALLPAYLKYAHEYTITDAQISPDDPTKLGELRMSVFRRTTTIERSRRPVLTVSAHLLRTRRTGALYVTVYLCTEHARLDAITAELQSDFAAFEREFERNARGAYPTACDVIGHGAVVPCVLLCMLVYTEHVFAPLDTAPAAADGAAGAVVERTQRAAPYAKKVRMMLARYWGMGETPVDQAFDANEGHAKFLYPFLVRLMPVEFVLAISCEKIADPFIFVKPSTQLTE